jgi:exoribonuclease-2
VRRITYEEADKEIAGAFAFGAAEDTAALRALYELSQKIYKRRTDNGSVNIELPDIQITVKDGEINVEPVISYRSSLLVRECMITAGEGAGNWAVSRGLIFPYISQEVEIQGKIPGGLPGGVAGSWQLRRCMRPRLLSTKPGCHQGLGLDTYSQVTSPLRRYTDLLTHIQIRSFLQNNPLPADKIVSRMITGETAAIAAVQAERLSRSHWTMVYLKGNRWTAIIPDLALETQVPLHKEIAPNDTLKLVLKSVNIPRGEAVFLADDRG